MKQITIKVKKLVSLKEKSVGMLLYRKPMSLYFETRWGIHTFGVKFPIDVLILDKENKVKVIKENLAPNNIYFWNPLYFKIIELPVLKVRELKVNIEDEIIIDIF